MINNYNANILGFIHSFIHWFSFLKIKSITWFFIFFLPDVFINSILLNCISSTEIQNILYLCSTPALSSALVCSSNVRKCHPQPITHHMFDSLPGVGLNQRCEVYFQCNRAAPGFSRKLFSFFLFLFLSRWFWLALDFDCNDVSARDYK